MFRGLAPWMIKPARAPAAHQQRGRLHHLCHLRLFGRHRATIGKMTLPSLKSAATPTTWPWARWRAGHAGLLIPPSIIMIVYGVAANGRLPLFLAGVFPGCCWPGFHGLYRYLGAVQPGQGAGVGPWAPWAS